MPGALLDTNALYWLVTGIEPMGSAARLEIARSQAAGMLYVSPISSWELALAARKPAHKNPVQLGSATPAQWFRKAVEATRAKIVPIGARIAIEAAEVVLATGHKDPGDCYLVATARVKNVPIVTRDSVLQGFASPGYLDVILC